MTYLIHRRNERKHRRLAFIYTLLVLLVLSGLLLYGSRLSEIAQSTLAEIG